MIDSNFLENFAKLIGVDQKELTQNFKLNEYAGWDSVAVLSTISIFEKYCNKSLTIEQVLACKDFGSLLALAKLDN